jgi:hypothetical protein
MAEKQRFTFEETDNGFLLREIREAQPPIDITMSEDDLLGFMATVSLWRDRILLRAQAKSGQVQAVIAHSVSHLRLNVDAMDANILLTFGSDSGAGMTFSVPPEVAALLAAEIPPLLDKIAEAGGQSYS